MPNEKNFYPSTEIFGQHLFAYEELNQFLSL